MKKITRVQAGFTLIEILVVIGIIAVLAAVVLIAINPARQFAQANDSQRTANANAILNAIGQFMADNQGTFPADVDGATDDEVTENLCDDLVPDYMPALPTDPTSSNDGAAIECADWAAGGVDYHVTETAAGRIQICAPNTQLAADDICVIR